jgi:hypothetical protein
MYTFMNHSWPDFFLFIAMTVAPDTVQFQNENLLMTRPEGYKTDFQEKTTDTLTSEMVPLEQSANNWTEIVRVQIFHGLKATPEQFKMEMDKARARVCSVRSSQALTEAKENGYATLVWYDSCSLSAATGNPEFSWFKGIQGNDSFYLVQVSLKVQPSEEVSVRWMDYLKRVRVCDTRLPARACPTDSVSR